MSDEPVTDAELDEIEGDYRYDNHHKNADLWAQRAHRLVAEVRRLRGSPLCLYGVESLDEWCGLVKGHQGRHRTQDQISRPASPRTPPTDAPKCDVCGALATSAIRVSVGTTTDSTLRGRVDTYGRFVPGLQQSFRCDAHAAGA